ncbi:transposase [Streptomyces wedmorensis]|uniref:transposase n=1 Tax=Streptomyces wedmorensis TaxID=43759 RepID=UPI0037B473F8
MGRGDLSDREWSRLEGAAPEGRWQRRPVEGSPDRHQRDLFEAPDRCAVAYLPVRFGSWKTIHDRHRRWSVDGTWDEF